MIKKLINSFIELIKEEYKFLIFLILLFILFRFPLNYYIIIGGGTSDVSSRIKVEDKYQSKGSFNISYVTELKGTLLTYALSYIIPKWERESADNYKYNDSESIEDIEFRNKLSLDTSNGTATYWAYTLANKEVELMTSKLYVITVLEEFKTPLKVQDEIISVDDQHFDSIIAYKDYFQTKQENDIVKIKVKRKKKEIIIDVPLHKYDNKLVLGVGLQYLKTYKTDPKVNIKFKHSESGPSGGLITTLEIYNQLTKKDLTKGLKIAGTGTIEEDGTIGEIGGVEHKILGAESDKADIFLVPSGNNYEDAIKYKKEKNLKIKIIEIKNIQEAIKILKEIEV